MRRVILLGLLGLLLGVTEARADRWKHRHRGHGYGYSYGPGFNGYGYGPARFGPPPMRREYCGRPPGPRHVWVPGNYGWGGNGYHWNNGYWAMPPRPYATWVPGYWRPQNGVHIWIGGFWR